LLTIGSLFALGVGAAYAQGPVTYSTPALRGRVVAKETASPLAGAHVLAAWQGNEAQPLIRPATVKLLETATAPDGSFWVPAWGPESLPTPIYWQSPTVVVFLPGYEPWRLDLGLEFRGNEAKIRDPLDIRLSRFEKKPEDWAQHLSEATWVLAYFAAPLKPMPQLRMLSAVEAEWRQTVVGLRTEVKGLRDDVGTAKGEVATLKAQADRDRQTVAGQAAMFEKSFGEAETGRAAKHGELLRSHEEAFGKLRQEQSVAAEQAARDALVRQQALETDYREGAATTIKSGAGAPQVIAFVTAWSVHSLQRLLMWELPVMDPKAVWVRVAVSVPLPFLAAAIAMLVGKP